MRDKLINYGVWAIVFSGLAFSNIYEMEMATSVFEVSVWVLTLLSLLAFSFFLWGIVTEDEYVTEQFLEQVQKDPDRFIFGWQKYSLVVIINGISAGILIFFGYKVLCVLLLLFLAVWYFVHIYLKEIAIIIKNEEDA